MINPDRVHRIKAFITDSRFAGKLYECKTNGGMTLRGYDLPNKFMIGDQVNLQIKFSIMADRYVIKTINKPRIRR